MPAAHRRSAVNSGRKMVQRERRTSSSRSFPERKTAPRNSPMLLVSDAGNTNITVAVFREMDLIVQWRLITEATRTSDEYGVQLRNLFALAGIDVKNIDAIVIASVVPSLNQTLKRVAELYFNLQPLFVDHTSDTGFKILYEPPSDVGADRIVDAVAAVAKYGAPCIVVDFGTATTFNAINSAGEYLGGGIAPGLMISRSEERP